MKKDIVQYISNADVCVGVIPEIGGTIVFLSKNNSENLIKSDPALWNLEKRPNVDENTGFVPYCGHTVWLGPQNEWWVHQEINQKKKQENADWPPDPYLYISEYSVVEKTASAIRLKGPHSPISGVTIEKEIAVNPDGSVFVQAMVHNTGSQPCAWDVWHNTRFDGKCKMSVAALAENVTVVPVLSESSIEMPFETENRFFSYIPQKPPQNYAERSSKSYIYPTEPFVSIETKKFNVEIWFEMYDKKLTHPKQAMVEIYNHTEHGEDADLLEVEYHSPYKTLNVGDCMSAWEVWKIVERK